MNGFLQNVLQTPQDTHPEWQQRRDHCMQTLDKSSQAFIEGLAQPGQTGPGTPEALQASK
jgi:hypothetical protein